MRYFLAVIPAAAALFVVFVVWQFVRELVVSL